MSELIIIGNIDQLNIIAKAESGRARKYDLSISINEDNSQEGASSPLDVIDPKILELNSKNEALEGENITLTENNTQLVSELEVAKNKIEELNKDLHSEKEPRKRRTKAEIEADKKAE